MSFVKSVSATTKSVGARTEQSFRSFRASKSSVARVLKVTVVVGAMYGTARMTGLLGRKKEI